MRCIRIGRLAVQTLLGAWPGFKKLTSSWDFWWLLGWKLKLTVINFGLVRLSIRHTAWKVSKYEVFSGPYFAALGLNTERYVSLCIQSESGKIRTRKNSVFLDTFTLWQCLKVRLGAAKMKNVLLRNVICTMHRYWVLHKVLNSNSVYLYDRLFSFSCHYLVECVNPRNLNELKLVS